MRSDGVGRHALRSTSVRATQLSIRLRRLHRGPRRDIDVGTAEIERRRAVQRHTQREHAPLAYLALDRDVAAVFAQDLATDRETEAGPLRALGADKGTEDLLDLRGRDAAAVVSHGDPYPF